MLKLVAIIMGLISVAGSPANGSQSDCQTRPRVATQGLCLRQFGVGSSLSTVAVPCIRPDLSAVVCMRKR
jgi:cytochrome c biogenesis protein CcdA